MFQGKASLVLWPSQNQIWHWLLEPFNFRKIGMRWEIVLCYLYSGSYPFTSLALYFKFSFCYNYIIYNINGNTEKFMFSCEDSPSLTLVAFRWLMLTVVIFYLHWHFISVKAVGNLIQPYCKRNKKNQNVRLWRSNGNDNLKLLVINRLPRSPANK